MASDRIWAAEELCTPLRNILERNKTKKMPGRRKRPSNWVDITRQVGNHPKFNDIIKDLTGGRK